MFDSDPQAVLRLDGPFLARLRQEFAYGGKP
jgi:hypothetical protein